MAGTAKVQKGYKSLIVDRTIPHPEIGRLKIAIGSADPKVRSAFNTMLDGLIERGRFDDIRAIKERRIPPLAALDQWKNGKLKGAESILTDEMLADAVARWMTRHADKADSTRRDYRNHWKALLAIAPKSAKVKDLPQIAARYRQVMEKKEATQGRGSRTFNQTRKTALAFAKAHTSDASDLYRAIRKIEPMEGGRKRERHAATVEEIVQLTRSLPEHIAGMVWTLATTGMRLSTEYFKPGGYELHDATIHIKGSKSKAAKRWMFLVEPFARPRVRYATFHQWITVATSGRMTPYDLRGTFMRWLKEAGIDYDRRRVYRGHSTSSERDSADRLEAQYTTYDVRPYLASDAAAFKAWLDAEKAKVPEPTAPVEKVKLTMKWNREAGAPKGQTRGARKRAEKEINVNDLIFSPRPLDPNDPPEADAPAGAPFRRGQLVRLREPYRTPGKDFAYFVARCTLRDGEWIVHLPATIPSLLYSATLLLESADHLEALTN